MNKKILFCLLILYSSFLSIYSQVDREFWFAIPKETSGHPTITAINNVSFKITAMSLDAQVTISMPANGAFATRTFLVPAGQSRIEVLATSFLEFQDIYNNVPNNAVAPISCKTDRGIRITSDNDITVYYDYDNANNRDLFSLKGKNALGLEFYTPFQTIWASGAGYNPRPYSSIEIVATEDGTEIDVFPTQRIEGYPWPIVGSIHISLNRGEAYSLRANGPLGADHPTGTHIVSNKKIAVTINDDSVRGAQAGCYDIIGDQLVPTDIIGSKYLVMTGDRANSIAGVQAIPPDPKYNTVGEQIVVTATQPNTIIYFKNRTGQLIYQTPILGKGGTDYISPDIQDPLMTSIYVTSNDPSKKFYVLHITGIGCELGGAILPPITDCTGSSEVSFFRSTTVIGITINLMIPIDKTMLFTDAGQSYNFFTLTTYNLDGTIDNTFPIPGSWFESNDSAGWAVLKIAERDFGAETKQGRAHKIVNSQDFFHLGMTNGSGPTNKYGYFSSFNSAKAEVFIPQNQEDNIITCFGDPVTVVAKGGLSYTWHYGAPNGFPTYLSDPKSANPEVIGCPVGSHNFYVEVQQAKCFGTDTLKVNVVILPVVTAKFEVDKQAVCSPDTVLFTNKSINANIYSWKKQIDAGAVFDMPPFTAPNTALQFREYLNNPSTTTPQIIQYILIAESNQGCSDIDSIKIKVFPRIEANFSQDDTLGCNPLPVQFTNLSGGNITDSSYYWKFGDQGTSAEIDPFHTFTNFGIADTFYTITLIAKSPSPSFCTDTARAIVTVHPYIFANYAADTVRGCSPLQIKIQNGSLGAISRYKWDYGNADTSDRSDASHYYTYTNTGAIDSTRRLKLSVFNAAGCLDSMSRLFTAYPEINTQFSASTDTGCTPLPVGFVNLSNAAADSFYWDFGDGNSSYLKNPFHEYKNLSVRDTTFKVKLRATTSELCPGYDSTNVLVRGFIDPRFSVDTTQYCAPFNITVKNKSIHSPTAILSWNFGDNPLDTITSAANIVHLYRNQTPFQLNYNVRLNLTGSGGCNKTLIKPVKVFPEIAADFIPDTTQGCNPLPITFTNLSTDSVAQSFIWNFGDSASSVEKDPIHTYKHLKPTDQVYKVQLIAQSEFNCSDTISKNITVYSYIDALFSIDKGWGCSPLNVTVTDSSSGGIFATLPWTSNGNLKPVIGGIAEFLNKSDTVQIENLALEVMNNKFCRKKFSRPITVYPEVDARFILGPDTIGCTPFKVDFQHGGLYPSIISKYRWEYGDSASAVAGGSISHTFSNPNPTIAKYKTSLIVYSIYNCSDSMEKTISVYPYINADFVMDTARRCSPLTTLLINNSSDGANTFNWIYGDGTPSLFNSTDRNPHSHIYINSGISPITFQTRLTASYNNLCQKDIQQTVEVYPAVTPLFIESTLSGCHPLEIIFTNKSIDKGNLNFNWYFGDDGSSIDSCPSHTYANYTDIDAFYNVKLVATSEYNCTNQISKTVTVFPGPKAYFEVLNSINCPPFNVQIDNRSEIGDTFFWTFGDGQNLTQTILGPLTHRYFNATSDIYTYDLDLLVKTIHDCSVRTSQNINVYPRVKADFEPDTSGCSPLLVEFKNSTLAEKYIWDFGDKGSSKIQSPTNRFFSSSVNDTIFNVSLIGISKFGCRDTAKGNITVYPQPEARFFALPSVMDFPESTTNISNQTNNGSWNYLWDFGDGNTSTLRDPLTYSYSTWGNYSMSLKAYSGNCSNSTSLPIKIFPAKPIAKFVASADGCVPLIVEFTDSSKYANSWKWLFDDGGQSNEQNPKYTYLKAGRYNVKLTVSGDGGTDFTYQQVNVFPKPAVKFILNPNLVMLPDSSRSPDNKDKGWVQFTNLSKDGDKFLWDFGDGGSSIDPSPRYQYSRVGEYGVTLSVWTENGCFDSINQPKAILVMLRKDIKFPNAFTPNPSRPNAEGTYNLSDINNDIFHPYWVGITDFKMEIYDRWGERIFECDNINKGWDGYYKGKLCKSDVYVYKASGKYADGSSFNVVGDLTLIR